jgi:hypothetical protein
MKVTRRSVLIAGGLVLGAGIPAKSDAVVDLLIMLIDPTAAMIVYTEDCSGELTAEGHTAIDNFRQDDSTRTVLDARVGAWRKQLGSMRRSRKCTNVSRYLAGSYAREFVVQSER